MTKDSLSFILARRGVRHPGNANRKALETLIAENGGPITPREAMEFEDFKANLIDGGRFKRYKTVAKMCNAIEIFSKRTILYHPTSGDKHGKLLTYCKMYDIPYEIPEIEFTEEQRRVIAHRGLLAVNAGPGTGKTTVANEKAYQLRNEGVLIFSYTNAAIDENYQRLKIYPIDKELGRKNVQSPVNVTTVDSLATAIIGVAGDFDKTCRMALEQIRSGKVAPFLRKYRHIIVDEAQDIDETRGALIMELSRALNCDSVTVFGDPRQRLNSNKGKWYIDLCKNALGLTFSHRFQTQGLLDLCNSLSITRPDIHHELAVNNAPEEKNDEPNRPIKAMSIQELVDFITERVDSKVCSYSDFAVMGPSMDRENISSTYMKQLMAIFKEHGIRCYKTSDKSRNYMPDAVLFSTIHSIKGKEFDYVIATGMSDYNNRYKHIPREDMDSLIFVAHTRAKKRMFYLQESGLIPPRGVLEEYIEGTIEEGRVYPERQICSLRIKSASVSQAWSRFANTNGIILTTMPSISMEKLIPRAPDGWSDELWRQLIRMTVGMCATGVYPEAVKRYLNKDVEYMNENRYKRLLYQGKIVDGRFVDSGQYIAREDLVNIPRDSERNAAKLAISKPIKSLSNEDIVSILRIYDYMLSDTMLSRYDTAADFDFDILPACEAVAEELTDAYGQIETEVKVENRGYLGFAELLSDSTVIDLATETTFRPLFFKHLLGDDRDAIVINVHTGEILTVDANQSQERWDYFLRAFFTIYVHNDLVTQRLNRMNMVPQALPDHIYLADTEFAPVSDIFDLAMVNYNDPFRTFCQPIKCSDIDFACRWSGKPARAFTTSKTIEESRALFNATRFTDVPKILYYVCPTDHTWYPECETLNLGPIARVESEKTGSFIRKGQPPPLEEFYDVHSGHLLEFQSHLKAHEALSDALMLWELVAMGVLKIGQE